MGCVVHLSTVIQEPEVVPIFLPCSEQEGPRGGLAVVPRSMEVGSQPHCRLLPCSPWHQGSADRPCELWVRMPAWLGVGSSDTLVA